MANALGNAVHHAGDDHAAIAVAREHHIVQVFEQDRVHHVVDVGLEIDVRTAEVHALTESGESHAIDGVAVGREKVAGLLPLPTASGGAVDDDVG